MAFALFNPCQPCCQVFCENRSGVGIHEEGWDKTPEASVELVTVDNGPFISATNTLYLDGSGSISDRHYVASGQSVLFGTGLNATFYTWFGGQGSGRVGLFIDSLYRVDLNYDSRVLEYAPCDSTGEPTGDYEVLRYFGPNYTDPIQLGMSLEDNLGENVLHLGYGTSALSDNPGLTSRVSSMMSIDVENVESRPNVGIAFQGAQSGRYFYLTCGSRNIYIGCESRVYSAHRDYQDFGLTTTEEYYEYPTSLALSGLGFRCGGSGYVITKVNAGTSSTSSFVLTNGCWVGSGAVQTGPFMGGYGRVTIEGDAIQYARCDNYGTATSSGIQVGNVRAGKDNFGNDPTQEVNGHTLNLIAYTEGSGVRLDVLENHVRVHSDYFSRGPSLISHGLVASDGDIFGSLNGQCVTDEDDYFSPDDCPSGVSEAWAFTVGSAPTGVQTIYEGVPAAPVYEYPWEIATGAYELGGGVRDFGDNPLFDVPPANYEFHQVPVLKYGENMSGVPVSGWFSRWQLRNAGSSWGLYYIYNTTLNPPYRNLEYAYFSLSGTFNCLGANTFNFQSVSLPSISGGWPASITLNPV